MTNQAVLNLVKLFAESAANLGRYHGAGDANRDEFAIELARLEAIYELLEEKDSERAIETLLASSEPYVVLYAAKMLLLSDEVRARDTLRQLSASADRVLAFNADLFLTHWEKGWLFPKRRMKRAVDRWLEEP